MAERRRRKRTRRTEGEREGSRRRRKKKKTKKERRDQKEEEEREKGQEEEEEEEEDEETENEKQFPNDLRYEDKVDALGNILAQGVVVLQGSPLILRGGDEGGVEQVLAIERAGRNVFCILICSRKNERGNPTHE